MAYDAPKPAAIIEAIAEHGHGAIGGMLPNVDCTTVTVGRTLQDGGRFICTKSGHLADGAVIEIHRKLYRLNVVVPAQVWRAA